MNNSYELAYFSEAQTEKFYSNLCQPVLFSESQIYNETSEVQSERLFLWAIFRDPEMLMSRFLN